MSKKQQRVYEFVWEGLNQKRSTVSGELEAPSISQARAILRQRGIRVKKLKRKPQPLFQSNKKVKPIDITLASRQMATMISAGIPIAQTLRGIGKGHENPAMEKLMTNIGRDVESGASLSNALDKHPQYFNRLFVSLTQAGEESGTLDTMLDKVAQYNEKLAAIKSKVKSALTYPIVVLVAALGVTIVMLMFVIPQFETLFKDSGAALPGLTQALIDASEWLRAKWYYLLIGTILFIIIFSYIYKRSDALKFSLDRIFLRLPLVGHIFRKSALARFARTLSIIFGSGVPLVDGLRTVGAASGNRVYEMASEKIRQDISTGKTLESGMTSSKVFPNMMLQMVASGEESGELENMLDKVADFYEREVDDAVDAMASIIEPVMIILLGGIIGTMIMGMYLPIFKLASVF